MSDAEGEDGPAVLRRTIHAQNARHERTDIANRKLHLVQSLVKQGHMPSMVLVEVNLERAGVQVGLKVIEVELKGLLIPWHTSWGDPRFRAPG